MNMDLLLRWCCETTRLCKVLILRKITDKWLIIYKCHLDKQACTVWEKPGLWVMGNLVETDRLMKDMEKMGIKIVKEVRNDFQR